MTDRELMQQALDAMMTIRPYEVVDYDPLEASITTLRERLAQPEPAPGYCQHCKQYTIEEPLPAQPEQEPVAVPVAFITDGGKGELWWSRSVDENGNTNMGDIPLYTTPPRREWVGLTEEEVYPLANAHLHHQPESYSVSGIYDLARAIEAKLREKNA